MFMSCMTIDHGLMILSMHTVGATLGLGSVSVGPALQVVVINDFSDDNDADDDEDNFEKYDQYVSVFSNSLSFILHRFDFICQFFFLKCLICFICQLLLL